MASAVIGALRVNLGIDSAQFTEGLRNLQGTLKSAGKQMQSVGRQMSTYVTAPLAGFGALTLKVAGDFEKSMNQVAAVSGATGDEFVALRDLAKELGASTQFSASEAADAMNFLAMAGMEVNDILGAMPNTLQLASAAQLDMASAADIVTNILAGYNMGVEELGHATDVLVKSFTSANTDLSQLAEAMKYAGPVASAAGVQFEEAAAAMAMMGNAGIQGSMAGTSLRGAISRILAPTKAMAGAMAEAGLSFTDASGKLLPLADIIEQLEPHADNAGLFMELFGQRAGPAMAALVSQGADAVRELTGELENSAGTASEISAVQMEGFNGAMRELTSAFEGLQLAIADSGLIEWATEAVQAVTKWVQEISKSNPELLKWGTIVGGLAATIGPVLVALGLFVTAIAAISAPVLAVIAGIAALTAGIIAVWPEIDAAGKAVNEFLFTLGDQARAKIDAFIAKVVEMKDMALQAVQAMVSGVTEWVSGKLNAVWDSVTSRVDRGKNSFYNLYDAVVVNSYIPDMVTEIGEWMGLLDQNMVQPAQQAVDGVSSSMESLGDTGQLTGSAIGNAFKGVIDGSKSVKQAISEVLQELASMLANNAFKMLAGGLFGGGGGGGFLGGLFSSFAGLFAKGGTIGAGKWGIAGEAGPEIVKGPAQVIPMSQIGSPVQQIEVSVVGSLIDDNGVIKGQINQMGAQAAQAGASIAVRQVNQGLPSMIAESQARKM